MLGVMLFAAPIIRVWLIIVNLRDIDNNIMEISECLFLENCPMYPDKTNVKCSTAVFKLTVTCSNHLIKPF